MKHLQDIRFWEKASLAQFSFGLGCILFFNLYKTLLT